MASLCIFCLEREARADGKRYVEAQATYGRTAVVAVRALYGETSERCRRRNERASGGGDGMSARSVLTAAVSVCSFRTPFLFLLFFLTIVVDDAGMRARERDKSRRKIIENIARRLRFPISSSAISVDVLFLLLIVRVYYCYLLRICINKKNVSRRISEKYATCN